MVFLTDDKTIVENIRPTNTIFCAQRQAVKKIVEEEDLVKANIASFGDDIGKVTNRITAMFDLQAQFEPGSKEYEVLDYRIKSGQLFQQNAIDKAKGIVCKPMPRHWYDLHANNQEAENAGIPPAEYIGTRLLADRKPYFMRYNYPDLMKQFNTYVKNASVKCVREFRMELKDLLALPADRLTDQQIDFIAYYKSRLPVGDHDCVMNRICRLFEQEFDKYTSKHPADVPFDYRILQSGAGYTYYQKRAIEKLYEEYIKQLERFRQEAGTSTTTDEYVAHKDFMLRELRVNCFEVCSDAKVLCDILVDVCYQSHKSKQLVWDLCGDELIENLLEKNNWMIKYPEKDPDGDVEYSGLRFSIKTKEVAK